ncbi:MAG: sigma-70 family RNA polymerase sigma factor [Balneolaceae bacterium]|nr:sigma-70 family RNA polymerase sigma factor [Balneolaceae bacterium]
MMEQYWKAYSDKVFFFLNKRIRNREVARDLLQDTFQKALTNKNQLQNAENPEAWLMSVARNTLIDYTRKKKEVSLGDIQMINSEDFTSDKERLVDGIAECLYELIDEYDDDERQLLIDVFTKSMTQKEMAKALDIPYSTFKSRIQKAREQILTEFKNRCCTLSRNSKGEIIGCTPIEKPQMTAADC